MNKKQIKKLSDLFKDIQSKAGNRIGFILKPSTNGFDVYELPEKRIKELLNVEAVHRHYSQKQKEQEEEK